MSAPELDFVPVPASDVESRELDGERLLWRGAVLHHLDAIGTLVWQCFDGETATGDIARMLAEEFGVEERSVQRDVTALCEELFEAGMLAGSPFPAAPDPLPDIQPGEPPTALLSLDREFPHATGRCRALDHDFAVRTDDARLARYFDRALRSFAAPGRPARWYSVVTASEPGVGFHIYLDGEGLFSAADKDMATRYLLWHVNFQTIRSSSGRLLIHAGGATNEKHAVVLPGDINAGKTTLVAGLLLDGLGLLTDEIVALNLQTRLVEPYPRALNVGDGSWDVLPRLRPDDRDEDEADAFPRLLWHVDPTSVRPDAVAEPAPIGWVITPRFQAGAETHLVQLPRAAGAALLYRHAFNGHQLDSAGIRVLVDSISHARCARLVNGDLNSAFRAVRAFLEQAPVP